MNLKQTSIAIAIIGFLAVGMASCQSQEKKDADTKAKIEAVVPGVAVDVKDGIVTLNGEFPDDATRSAAEQAATKVSGVQSVVNNTTVTVVPAPVVVNPDDALIASSMSVLKEYPGTNAEVKDGVIMLSGEIKKANWIKLKQALDALRPKKVDNTKLKIK